jgi:hypothetical protein
MRNELHMTLGVAPSRGLNIEEELQMIKTSLLYADKLKLCSIKTSMLLGVSSLANFNDSQKIDFLEEIFPYFVNNESDTDNMNFLINQFRTLINKKGKSKKELQTLLKIKKSLKDVWIIVTDKVEDVVIDTGLSELTNIIKNNILEIQLYDYAKEDQVEQYFESISNPLINGYTYPIFDETSADLIRLAIKEGELKASKIGLEKSKQSGLVLDLFDKLPNLENASIDQILDVRKELSEPLIRFRSAIVQYSEEIENQPWDEDFYYEVEKIFIKNIEPAVLEIEEACKSNSYIKNLLISLPTKPLQVASMSGLGILISKLSDFSELFGVVTGLAVGAGTAIYQITKEWKEKSKNIQKNQMYFYYKTRKRLDK